DIGLRRFYTSMYAPGATPASVNTQPLGARWQHNYMSWLDRHTEETQQEEVVVHLHRKDITFHAGKAQECDLALSYVPPAGHGVVSLNARDGHIGDKGPNR